jgi:general nucleoside transport system ATP-binding protein
MQPVVEISNVQKTFGTTKALRGVDLNLYPREIVGILGENGAGKTTLMNVLYGLVEADQGDVSILGNKIDIHRHSPAKSLELGLSMVHQHFMLVNRLSVAENLIIGKEPSKLGLIDFDKAASDVRRLVKKYDLQVNPGDIVRDLSVSQRQRLEILRALYHQSKILILDEPTAVLAPSEVDSLFEIIGNLKNDGLCVVLISHKLDEVLRICNRIYILRKGKLIAETSPNKTDKNGLAKMMVGESYKKFTRKEKTTEKHPDWNTPNLIVENLFVSDMHGSIRVQGANLQVFPGEIVSIAGVAGNGQSQLEKALVGLMPVHKGKIFIDGVDVSTLSIRERRDKGLGYIPQDRHEYGLISNFPLRDNLILGRHRLPQFSRYGIMDFYEIEKSANRSVDEFNIVSNSVMMQVSNLSGGNQQKVVLARAVSGETKILLASQISRGLDVSAVASIYQFIREFCNKGVGILLFSFDLDEVLEISDRIYVMRDGLFIGPLTREETSRDYLGQLITRTDLTINQ